MTVITNFKVDTKELDEMIARNPQRLADAVGETAFQVLTDARIITPRDPARPPKDLSQPITGALRANSNVVKNDDIGLSWNVEYYQEYAPYQELGAPAINLPARPFLTPSVENNFKTLVSKITKAVNK